MAVISAGFVPVPAVDGGAGEVLTTEIINGNEKQGDYFMDIYTIESPKLNEIKYNNAEIIQIHITKWNWFLCKARNILLKLLKRRYRFIPYNRALIKQFRDNYDVILVENNMQVYEDIYNHTKKTKDNIIYHMHNDIDGTTKPKELCELIAQTAKRILVVSEYLKERFNQVAPNNKLRVFYNCVDFEIFNAKKEYEIEKLRKKYEIEKDDFIFVYTGRICPEKGILELVRAFKRLLNNNNNIKLLVVGSRWYNLIDKDEYFKKLIKESEEFKKKIIFTGYIYPENMPSIYAMGNILVIPSMWEEPFGVVALEGMAMKIPIIATKSGGLVEILNDKMALMIDKQEHVEKKLENAMQSLIKDDDKRNMLVENAFKEVNSRYEYQKNNYYRIFREIINE